MRIDRLVKAEAMTVEMRGKYPSLGLGVNISQFYIGNPNSQSLPIIWKLANYRGETVVEGLGDRRKPPSPRSLSDRPVCCREAMFPFDITPA